MRTWLSWFWRRAAVALVVVLPLASPGCTSEGGVGAPCTLNEESSKKNVEVLKDKARVVEPSFVCDFPYCIATDDSKPPGEGYCTKVCDLPADCPDKYTCKLFLEISDLPPEKKNTFQPLLGKKLCIRNPPAPEV